MIVLDTSAIIELIDGTEKGRKVEELIKDDAVCVSVVAVNEFLCGGSVNSKKIFHELLATTRILVFDERAAYKSVFVEESLNKKGKPIGKLDCFIAAICLVHNLPLISCDKDFKNVDGLKVILV